LEKKKKRREEMEARKPKQELADVIVTEIIDANHFYVQIVGAEAEQLEELMKELSIAELGEAYTPKKGELVRAQFSADDRWYRAKVLDVLPDGARVLYVDYGNVSLMASLFA
jgi:tudor domain-containing protein 2